MNYIISKGGLIARYRSGSGSSLILRTPITMTLQPDERALYTIAGRYDTSTTFPVSGFIEQNTLSNVQAMGKECCIRGLNPTAYQKWTMVNTSHDPETCWYNGAFATSAPTIQSTFDSCEAYAQFGAYHFAVPTLPDDISMSIQLIYTSGGACQCYQSAGLRSSLNKPLRGFGEWGTSWQPPVAVYTGDLRANYNRLHLADITRLNHIDAANILADGATGGFRGVRDLWGFQGTTRDGGIPTLTTPITKTVNLSATHISWLRGGGSGVWLIPYVPMEYGSGASDYSPSYYTGDAGWWGCLSIWGLQRKVTIGG